VERTWTIVAVAFAILLGIALLFSVVRTRQVEIDEAKTSLTSLVTLLAAHGDRSIEDGDKLVRAVLPQVQAWDLSAPDQARAIMESMRQLMLGSPQVASAWIMSRDSVSILDTWTYPPTKVHAPERLYMRAHLAGEKGPFLAAQEEGSVSKKPRFTVSRAAYDDSGRLKAVVVAAIYSEYFSNLYSEAIKKRDAQAGLYLKQSDEAPGILARLGAGQPSKPFLDGLFRHAHDTSHGVDVVDGRLAAWRTLDAHKGSFASASVPIASLNQWQRRALELGLLYLFLALAFLGLLQLLYRMRAAGAESEYRAVMLAEVNHRVKNVMQILQSMIYSRSRDSNTAETKNTLDDLSTSVTALAELFATIQDDATTRDIDLSAVIDRICESFERATKRTIARDVEPVVLTDHAKATNVSLIVNELITNAVKHSEGEIRLSAKSMPKSAVIRIVGRKPTEPVADKPKSSGFGLKMVGRLASEIGATIDQTDHADRISVELKVPA
jgi:two-component sensor histidine kinase